MILALYGCCFALMVLVGIVAIPLDVRELIVENCKNSRGRFRRRYVVKEAVSLAQFYGQVLLIAGIFAMVLLSGLVILDGYIKLDIIVSVAEQADWDLVQMEDNLRSSPNNVEREFRKDHIAEGGTKESARSTMLFLWTALPVILLLSFVGMLTAMRFSSDVFDHALKSLASDELERNRRRIRQRYLRASTA
ncbi:hypothetical protein K227x_64750 [Rubripirellula lacrimiformis]|uniref:Transmembrane protein n=1 Tax=Rubripirellula lacrimiformis TaxID=1930273 RepID=A0A517NLP3_9BACT|nr:hypothetical protein [Rubripirellula lacrimiformis]QDT08045.1 hypothetical protein K227x_64750 [Rubripirellula lacrimiformis]